MLLKYSTCNSLFEGWSSPNIRRERTVLVRMDHLAVLINIGSITTSSFDQKWWCLDSPWRSSRAQFPVCKRRRCSKQWATWACWSLDTSRTARTSRQKTVWSEANLLMLTLGTKRWTSMFLLRFVASRFGFRTQPRTGALREAELLSSQWVEELKFYLHN